MVHQENFRNDCSLRYTNADLKRKQKPPTAAKSVAKPKLRGSVARVHVPTVKAEIKEEPAAAKPAREVDDYTAFAVDDEYGEC